MDHERHTTALQRLLLDARSGGPAKVDALLALAQRTVFVVPWPKPEDGWRTLVSSGGESALPIFSERAELEAAAGRFGWLEADGTAPALEVGSRETLRYARDRSLSYVVVDIASEHSIEITPAEMEPLLTPAARRDSSGPFSGTGRVSSTLMRAVQKTPSPMPAVGGIEPPRLDGRTPAPLTHAELASMGQPRMSAPLPAPPPGQAPSSPGVIAASPAAPQEPATPAPPAAPLTVLPSSPLGAPNGDVEDALLDRLDAVLRNYPEVEFGCIGGSNGMNVLGLRIDARLRTRIEALAAELGQAAGEPMSMVLLDETEHFRAARAAALVFFPWRRR